MSRFKKKQIEIEIEAVKVTKAIIECISTERIAMIPKLIIRNESKIMSMWTTDPHLIIATSEGNMRASIGDYIIEEVFDTVRGVYPCKPDIFHKTYDVVL